MIDDWIPLTHDLEKPNNSLAVDPSPWKILVVDDDPEVHEVTDFVPRDLRLFGRPLRLLPAHDGAQARAWLREHPDLAVALLAIPAHRLPQDRPDFHQGDPTRQRRFVCRNLSSA